MITLKSIGSQLQNFRKRQGLTLSELAERSHIHRNTLSALERGVGNVELNTLLALCEQLDLEFILTPKQTASFVRPAGTYPVSTPSLQKQVAKQLANTFANRLQNDDEVVRSVPMSKIQKRLTSRLAVSAKFPEGNNQRTSQESEPTALQKRISARLKLADKKGPK